MALPNVSVVINNGALGQVAPSADGCLGIICTGATEGTFVLGTTYAITKLADITAMSITVGNNPSIIKIFTDFYNQAPNGTKVYLLGVVNTVTMTTMLTDTGVVYAKKLLKDAGGEIRGLIVSRLPDGAYVPTPLTGDMDRDVGTAYVQAQLLAAASSVTPPIFIIIEGRDYGYTSLNTTALLDLHSLTNNRVGIMIGDTVTTATARSNAAMGILAGRIASMPVQRNIGRVKDGPVVSSSNTFFIKNLAVEQNNALASQLHDKGYITLRTFAGRTGYFFADDPLSVATTDDYSHLTARRTIDKAYRIAVASISDELNNEVSVNDKGQVSVSYAKSLENKVENAIINSMTVNGELGNDPQNQNDTGVQCLVDQSISIVSTGKLAISLRVKPYGYARAIEINLGFQILT